MVSINLYEIIFQWVNFLILLYLLHRFASKPLSAFLKNRADGIQHDIEQSQKNKEKTELALAEQKEILKNAHQDAQEIRKKAEASAKSELSLATEKAKEEANNLMESARKEVELEYTKAQQTLTKDVAALSIKLSEKLIQKNINEKENDALLKEFVGQVTT